MLQFLLLLVAAPLLVWAGVTSYLLAGRQRYLAYFRHKGVPAPERGALAVARVLTLEVGALMTFALWHVVGRFSIGRHVPPSPKGPPVLCVHGFMQNGTNWVGLRRHLHARGRITQSLSMGPPPREQDRYGDVVERTLESLVRDHGAVDIVCHSMGGVVLRRVLQRRPDLTRAVARVVTIASPHSGTAATRGLGRLPEGRAMARRGSWLDELPGLDELVGADAVTTLGSEDDTTVYPVETTRVPGARAVELPGLGHTGLVVYWEALGHVVAALKR